MGNLHKILATRKAKIYYELENEFESVGTRFVNWDMHYTAAHAKGLWLCGNVANNKPLIVGLVPWSNISRMIVDSKNERVYIEVKDNAGNISEHNDECKFRVNVDIKTPVCPAVGQELEKKMVKYGGRLH